MLATIAGELITGGDGVAAVLVGLLVGLAVMGVGAPRL
jgi:hypothetical protein